MKFYFKYYFSAITKYQIHPPFVFDFMTAVFEDDRSYYYFESIENYRRNLFQIRDKIAQNGDKKQLPIKDIAKNQSIDPFYGQLLFKVVNHYKPKTILELGTSLGISTLYQATPNPHIPVISLEKNNHLAEKTAAYFKKLGTPNVKILKGPFESTLKNTLEALGSLDHLFFNDFWGTDTTLLYYEECLKFVSETSIFIINKPYQSKESAAFWAKAKQHKMVKLSIDLYHLGFLFFRSEQKEVAHYQLIESWKKPWAVF